MVVWKQLSSLTCELVVNEGKTMKRRKKGPITPYGGLKKISQLQKLRQLAFKKGYYQLAEGEMKSYLIEVKKQGAIISTHNVVAPDALSAINLVEHHYTGPSGPKLAWFEGEQGDRHQVLASSRWRGYTFQARIIEPALFTSGEE